ncbi:MAG: response regulator transcription factor [Betaproteobacteria bacterium]|nr:response regulator transcription factor [Betaproteobacteria bacterium]
MRIAMLEDDVDVGAAMQQWLMGAGHTVHHFTSGKAIVREAGRESFDLFILDWQVPDLSGAEVLAWLREKLQSTTPVLFVTGRDSEEDIVSILSAGADDYMVKPVRRMEMLARVEALLRRSRPKVGDTESIDIAPYHIDLANRVVKFNDEAVEMTDKEFELTVFFFRNMGKLLSRGHISESVWGRSSDVQSRTVDTHISRIRKKLDLGPAHGIRLTPIYNFGYRMERVAVPDKPTA